MQMIILFFGNNLSCNPEQNIGRKGLVQQPPLSTHQAVLMNLGCNYFVPLLPVNGHNQPVYYSDSLAWSKREFVFEYCLWHSYAIIVLSGK